MPGCAKSSAAPSSPVCSGAWSGPVAPARSRAIACALRRSGRASSLLARDRKTSTRSKAFARAVACLRLVSDASSVRSRVSGLILFYFASACAVACRASSRQKPTARFTAAAGSSSKVALAKRSGLQCSAFLQKRVCPHLLRACVFSKRQL